MQLWIVPEGADKPIISETQWSNILPPSTKPFIFTIDSDFSTCYFDSAKDYAEFLKANPSAKGHVVVYQKGSKGKQEAPNYLLEILVVKYKIPRNQLKFFYARATKMFSGKEFWIVPGKKKK
jgi:hypothetical protein